MLSNTLSKVKPRARKKEKAEPWQYSFSLPSMVLYNKSTLVRASSPALRSQHTTKATPHVTSSSSSPQPTFLSWGASPQSASLARPSGRLVWRQTCSVGGLAYFTWRGHSWGWSIPRLGRRLGGRGGGRGKRRRLIRWVVLLKRRLKLFWVERRRSCLREAR